MNLEELELYGSNRLGVKQVSQQMSALSFTSETGNNYRVLGLKQYELSNHLGNVLSVISDQKLPQFNAGALQAYKPVIVSSQDYYPFGMVMKERTSNLASDGYRFGFDNQERTDEISGAGNHTTALFWEYDTRLGRRWNLDPKPQVSVSDYSVLSDNPLMNLDILGDKVTTTVERYKTMKDGTEKKPKRFSFRKANRIEIKHKVSGLKIYDVTKSVKKATLEKKAQDIQKEINDYWSTKPNQNGADGDGYITNDRGQKLKVTTEFENNIEIADDPNDIKKDDHVIAIVPEEMISGEMEVASYGSNIIYASKYSLTSMNGSFAHEWGHVGGLKDVMFYSKNIYKTHLMYNRVSAFNFGLFKHPILDPLPNPCYNELRRAFVNLTPTYYGIERVENDYEVYQKKRR